MGVIFDVNSEPYILVAIFILRKIRKCMSYQEFEKYLSNAQRLQPRQHRQHIQQQMKQNYVQPQMQKNALSTPINNLKEFLK